MNAQAFSFDQWWQRLQELAVLADWELAEQHEYRDYYDDGDPPEDTLANEMDFIEELMSEEKL